MSIPLANRKAIKEAVVKAEAHVKKAGEAIGETLVFTDNTADIWAALTETQQPWLQTNFDKYYEYLINTCTDFAKDPVRLEALKAAVQKVGGKVLLLVRPDDSGPDRFWSFRDDAWCIDVRRAKFAVSLFDHKADNLEKVMEVDFQGIKLPLKVVRNFKTGIAEVREHTKRASAACGKELTWIEDNYAQLYLHVDPKSRIDEFGLRMAPYAKQLADTLTEFCKNADNKEALNDALKSNKVGFYLEPNNGKAKPFIWKDGSLLLEIRPSYWGISHYEFSPKNLEATL